METILKTVLVIGAVLGGMSMLTFIFLVKTYTKNNKKHSYPYHNKMIRARVKHSLSIHR